MQLAGELSGNWNAGFGALTGLLFGLVLGSFASMASWRWPREESWLTRSHCPHCNQPLGPAQLVPLFSWLWQKGRAACCGKPISPRYPLIELANGLLLALAGWHYGLSPELAIMAVVITTLCLLSLIDIETGLIPDGSSVTIALAAGAWIYLHPPLDWWLPLASAGQNLLIGVLLAGVYSRLRGRDMMGWGDVKLMAASGLWLKPELAAVYLGLGGFLGVFFGLLWKKAGGSEEFPFAPALAVSLLVLIGWQALTL